MPPTEPTIAGHLDRVTGRPATVYTPPEDLVPIEPMPTDAHDLIRQQLIACAIAGADAERTRVLGLIDRRIATLHELRAAIERGDDDA